MAGELPGDQLSPLQNAVYLLKQAQAKLAAYERAQAEPIAVVGMSCRFPGAENPRQLWQLLCNGVDAIREVPPERWSIDDFYDPDPLAPGKTGTKWGGFLDHVDLFDADFFGISPREAIRVDPQQRLLLEVAWEALEDAGVPAGEISQTKAGVYVGIIGSDYALLQSRDLTDMDVFSGTGSSHAIVANRLSYVLNLNGPSVTLDTACSSSLVTVHLACQSLRRRETDLALAGGVNLILSPEMTMALTKAHMMAPDGRCKTFDAAANGYVRGEGVGMVVLKRLSDALADGDRLLAVIRGTAVNHDGRSNGLSAPNGPAQEAVLRTALADARLAPHQINYIEAHGTGTRLGDPIEIEALRNVLVEGRPADQPLLVASLKTNIGHLESAAGVAGLVKVVQMLRYGKIPPHLHLKTINPLLKLDDVPLEIPTELRDWPRGAEPHRAGVSSFGFGGTNGHVILEEAPPVEHPSGTIERTRHLLTISARSPQALADLAGRWIGHLEAHPESSLADMLYSANVGRVPFNHRAAFEAGSPDELRQRLAAFQAEPGGKGVWFGEAQPDRPPSVAFLFTGQGAQYAGMGGVLDATQPVFRAAIDQCAAILDEELDRPLRELLSPTIGATLDQTGYTQPVMFAVEYALAKLWQSWGVQPKAVLGHSVGEFAAACIAGVLSLEDGLRLIAARARLMQALPAGGLMAAVFAGEAVVSAALEPYRGRIAIAAFNGPENTVVSGDDDAVRELLARFEEQGVKSKTLVTSHAFHSHRLDPMLAQLDARAAELPTSAPRLAVVSNLTGKLADAATYADPTYWSRHARSPVRFTEGIAALVDAGCDAFLEIGPQPVLIGMGRRCVVENGHAWLPSLRQGRDEWSTILESLAQLYVRGAKIDWVGFDHGYARQKVDLPTYPFQRRPFWAKGARMLTADEVLGGGSDARQVHPLLGHRLAAAVSEQVFEAKLSANRPATLADHCIQGVVIMPGAGYVEMGVAASAVLHDGQPWRLVGLSLVEPLLLDKNVRTVQTVVAPESPGAAALRIVSVKVEDDAAEPTFTTHAVGRLEALTSGAPEAVDLATLKAAISEQHYDEQWEREALRKAGLEPGPTFTWSQGHWAGQSQGLAEVRAPREADKNDDYRIHPGLLDSGFQLLGALLPGAGEGIDAYVPMALDRLEVYGRLSGSGFFHGVLKSLEGNLAVGDIRLMNAEGQVLLQAEGVRLRRVPRDWLARLVAGPIPNWRYELHWIARPLEAPATPGGEATATPATAEPSPVEVTHDWLIFDDRGGLGGALAAQLSLPGHRCQVAPARLEGEARRKTVREFLAGEGSAQRGIVYLSALDVGLRKAAPDFEAARSLGWGGALDVIRAAAEVASPRPPRIWLVTRGAQAAGSGDHGAAEALAQSPLWGLGRVIAAEHPELACTRVDLDPSQPAVAAEQLAREVLTPPGEDQVVYRGGERRVARLRHLHRGAEGTLELPPGRPYRLEITSRGQLDNVTLRAVSRPQPGRGQVEIKVRATGLNFRDVLNVLNLYPGDPGPLGGECAGEVVAVGPGVEHVKPGDAVVALAPASFASYALTLGEFIAPKPEHLSFEEAATIPICFLTAHLALRRLANLQPGQRVLIHAASGGVGLAAIQIARRLGLEIFATAGSPRKREYLRTLGIERIYDSRSLEFAPQVLADTHGEGVDAIVNSLTGETIGASLSTLRAGGHFLELGKTDLWDQARVDQFKPGLTFHAIALDGLMATQPAFVQELIREVFPQFERKELEPLPLRTFHIQSVVDALRHMARAEHIGKVIIQAAAEGDHGVQGLTLREDGTYLVTGGLGGLGLKLARWLADRGARHLVLVGRSGLAPENAPQVDELRNRGVCVTIARGDVGKRDDVNKLRDQIAAEMPPLVGIYHLAGVLDDGVLREQTRERFDRVFAAKALGAWYLHDLTRDLPLEQFVLFSSAAALMGSPGQGNYASANAFLDALAHLRRAEKRPALSINWGSWAEVGMAARLQASEGKRWAAAGVGWIEPGRGMATMEELLVEDRVQAGVLPIDWPKFFERIPAGSEPAWLSDLAREARSAAPVADSGPPVLLEKLQEVTPGERLETALEHLRKQAARVLAMDDENLPDPRRPLNELGFDSLTAVEFCNRVGRSVGQHLNPTVLFDYPTLELLSGYVVRTMLHLETETAAAAPAESDTTPADDIREKALSDVEGLSEEEMDALVAAQLEKLQQ